MKLDPNLGMVYLAEQTSPDQNIVKNMDVIEKNGILYVDFETCLHSFDVLNRNQRYYDGKTQMEIAEEIGISQAQVSRLEKNALNTIFNVKK